MNKMRKRNPGDGCLIFVGVVTMVALVIFGGRAMWKTAQEAYDREHPNELVWVERPNGQKIQVKRGNLARYRREGLIK